MSEVQGSAEREITLRFAGSCQRCGSELASGTRALHDHASRSVRCLSCAPNDANEPPVDVGTPGASARREHERRHAKREADIRARHPKIGGFLHAVTDDPQSTRAWDTGAVGEELLGARLNELSNDRLKVLHDRRVPGKRSNIDHIAVTPTGVLVIDTKHYKGRPERRSEGGLFRPRVDKLYVGRRDCTKNVEGVLEQVEVVRGVLDEPDVPVRGYLCFVDAEWHLLDSAFTIRGVTVLWPKKLLKATRDDGPLDATAIERLHRLLGGALQPA